MAFRKLKEVQEDLEVQEMVYKISNYETIIINTYINIYCRK